MFEVKDKVFYGVVGVCEIVDIAQPPIKGIEGKYYFLQPVYDDKGLIYSPVDSKGFYQEYYDTEGSRKAFKACTKLQD